MIQEPTVNIAEFHIEEELFANPGLVKFGNYQIDHWIGRQYTVPSGRIDMLGAVISGGIKLPVVVEVKKGEINPEALVQVCRYAKDIEAILSRSHYTEELIKVVIGKNFEDRILWEASALNVVLITYEIKTVLTLDPDWAWDETVQEKIDRAYEDCSTDDIFVEFRR